MSEPLSLLGRSSFSLGEVFLPPPPHHLPSASLLQVSAWITASMAGTVSQLLGVLSPIRPALVQTQSCRAGIQLFAVFSIFSPPVFCPPLSCDFQKKIAGHVMKCSRRVS